MSQQKKCGCGCCCNHRSVEIHLNLPLTEVEICPSWADDACGTSKVAARKVKWEFYKLVNSTAVKVFSSPWGAPTMPFGTIGVYEKLDIPNGVADVVAYLNTIPVAPALTNDDTILCRVGITSCDGQIAWSYLSDLGKSKIAPPTGKWIRTLIDAMNALSVTVPTLNSDANIRKLSTLIYDSAGLLMIEGEGVVLTAPSTAEFFATQDKIETHILENSIVSKRILHRQTVATTGTSVVIALPTGVAVPTDLNRDTWFVRNGLKLKQGLGIVSISASGQNITYTLEAGYELDTTDDAEVLVRTAKYNDISPTVSATGNTVTVTLPSGVALPTNLSNSCFLFQNGLKMFEGMGILSIAASGQAITFTLEVGSEIEFGDSVEVVIFND